MNERIKELVLKARGQATSDTKDGGKCFDLDLFHKKFAELIVRDIYQYVDGMDTAQIISNGILKRYGVVV
jgi:hypothetical protein